MSLSYSPIRCIFFSLLALIWELTSSSIEEMSCPQEFTYTEHFALQKLSEKVLFFCLFLLIFPSYLYLIYINLLMLFYDILAILIIIFIDVIKKFTCNNNIVKDFIFH